MASPTKGTSLTSSPESIDSGLESSVGSDNDTSGDGKSVKKWGNCPPDANYLPPCRVCGAKASGLHYGANTCEPCKVCLMYCNLFLNVSQLDTVMTLFVCYVINLFVLRIIRFAQQI